MTAQSSAYMYIDRYKVTFKMTDVLTLTQTAIASVTEDEWIPCCKHVEDVKAA